VQLRLAPREPGRAEQEVRLAFANGAAVGESAVLSAKPDGVSVGGLIAGPHTLTVEFVDAKAEEAPIDMGGGRFRFDRKPYHHVTAEVDLVAGKKLEVDL
jgi:hypothetical protein